MKFIDLKKLQQNGKLPLLNLGCGKVYHPAWVNLDFLSIGDSVIKHDLTKGIPFENNSFDAVYHSHVLEHFSKEQGDFFISECFRVLKQGGIIRIAVPDLEVIAKNYLKFLNEAIDGTQGSLEKYEWAKLEMYDQVTRNVSGGSYLAFLESASEGTKSFARGRLGTEIDAIQIKKNPDFSSKLKSINRGDFSKVIKLGLLKIYLTFFGDSKLKDAFKTALFRSSGEIHQEMYDRLSLQISLLKHNFSELKVCSAFESSIKDFNDYQLDTISGNIRKPDSLFIEAIKK